MYETMSYALLSDEKSKLRLCLFPFQCYAIHSHYYIAISVTPWIIKCILADEKCRPIVI